MLLCEIYGKELKTIEETRNNNRNLLCAGEINVWDYDFEDTVLDTKITNLVNDIASKTDKEEIINIRDIMRDEVKHYFDKYGYDDLLVEYSSYSEKLFNMCLFKMREL